MSWNDLQIRDLAAFKPEEESQIGFTAGEVSFEVARHDSRSVVLLGADRLAGVGVFRGRFGLPLLDLGDAAVGAAFVLHHRVVGEASRYCFDAEPVGRKIGRDGFDSGVGSLGSPSAWDQCADFHR